MKNRWKGVWIAVSATVMTALAMGISVAGGLVTTTPLNLEGGAVTPLNAIGIVLAGALPIGLLFGALLGSLETPQFSARVRRAVFAGVAVLFVGACLPFWPDLAICAVPITALHAVVLARWTERQVSLPRAIAL